MNATPKPEAAGLLEAADEPLESSEGVDLSLVRVMLALSPSERLDKLRDFADAIIGMRHAADRG